VQDERDFQTYVSLFNNMSNFMKKPNIIVHLDVSPEESLRRIKLRDRGCESGITLEYLQGLHAAYEEFIADISRVIPVIKVNYSQFRTADEMATRIAEEYKGIANIRHVEFTPVTVSPSIVTAKEEEVAKKEVEVSVEGESKVAPVDLA
jgi:deoxyadenosine kinase